jgi:hypothetical protein
MRALWLIIPVVVLAGCDFGLKTCTSNAECAELNATCDTSTGFCVRDPLDGGPTGGGGGAMTGGGGGTTGGGSTGGGTPDGGPDAGMDAGTDSGVDAGSDSGVDAGFDAGADAGFDAGTCSFSTCEVGQECLNDTCTAVDLTIVQVGAPPTVGRLPVSVTGRLQRTSDAGIMGFRRPPVVMLTSSAALQFPSTAPVAGDSTFVISVTSDAGSGPATINASATLNIGAANGVLNVTSDTTAPILAIVSSSPAQTFQRDAIYFLAVSVNEPLNGPPSVRFGGLTVNPDSTGCTGDAGCWRIDMSVPPLDAMNGTLDLVISVTDRFGNAGSSSTPVSVTRKRWEVQAVGIGETVRATPAIGADGTIYLGSVALATTGSLVGIDPTDGGIIRSAVLPGAVQSLATAFSVTQGNSTGEELVFFTANDTLGRLGARKASDLTTTGVRNAETGNQTDSTVSGLALLQLGAGQVGAVGTFNGAPAVASRFSVFKPSSAAAGVDAPDAGAFEMSVTSNTADVPNNVIVDGTNAYFIASADPNTCTSQVVTSVTGSPTVGRMLNLFSSGNPCGTTAQSWVGNEVLVGGFAGGLSLFKFDASTATPVSGNLGVAVSNGASAVASNSVAFLGRGNDLIRYSPSMLSSGATRLATGVNIRTSPVLGKARSGDPAKGYAVDTSGGLRVFDQNGATDSAISFGYVFNGGPQSVRAHPTLDCNRRIGAATSTTGILYVASSSGRLSAIIVDSPRLLDATGAWPKYQRTAANAGNTNNLAFPLNPGCPTN